MSFCNALAWALPYAGRCRFAGNSNRELNRGDRAAASKPDFQTEFSPPHSAWSRPQLSEQGASGDCLMSIVMQAGAGDRPAAAAGKWPRIVAVRRPRRDLVGL
jgi:hypothetical protein